MTGTIEFKIWRADKKDYSLSAEHEEMLREAAEERFLTLILEGYTGGEIDCVLPGKREDIHYRGWWSYSIS